MSAICYTSFEVNGTEKEIDALLEAINAAGRQGESDTGIGDKWLGHLFTHLGYDAWKNGTGNIAWIGKTLDTCLVIDTDTVDGPYPNASILLMVRKYAPNAEVLYLSEMDAESVFISNWPEYVGKYRIEALDDWQPKALTDANKEPLTEEELRQVLEEATGEEGKTVKELIDLAEDWFDASIDKWEFESPWKWTEGVY